MASLFTLIKHLFYQVAAPERFFQLKYDAFRALLNRDRRAHEVMADLESVYHQGIKQDVSALEAKYTELSASVFAMVDKLQELSPLRYGSLSTYARRFDGYIRSVFERPDPATTPPYVLPLGEVTPDREPVVGNKAANLVRIQNQLNLPGPGGFVITTNSFHRFIEHNHLRPLIDERLSRLDIESTVSLNETAREIQQYIRDGAVPPELEEALKRALERFAAPARNPASLAVRSSAAGEDTRASFAGQYASELNVDPADLPKAYKSVLASKYSARVLFYRVSYGLSDWETPIAVLVLDMVDAVSSGIIYTRDLDRNEPAHLVIHAVWGLGQLLVGGAVSPDVLVLKKSEPPRWVMKKPGLKHKRLQISRQGKLAVSPVHPEDQSRLCLDEDGAFTLADWAMRLEAYFGEAQDIEWCRTADGNFWIVQSRPLIAESADEPQAGCFIDPSRYPVRLDGGESASPGMAAGDVYQMDPRRAGEDIPQGAVLVAENAAPEYAAFISRLGAVVTDRGSTAGHFSSVAREFGVPALVNTGNATALLTHGEAVTVHASDKKVYEGALPSSLLTSCGLRDVSSDSPYAKKLEFMIRFVSPLNLVDPHGKGFSPEGCRSLHDIIRFCHEKAMESMFLVSEKRLRKTRSAKKLESEIPLLCYVLDVGGGLKDGGSHPTVPLKQVQSPPMRAVFSGMSHPDIEWEGFTHMNWAEFDKLALSGGIISPKSAMLASYAILASDYANVNLRFGYHFVIIDALLGEDREANYVTFRHAGGGADYHQRTLRAELLAEVLKRLGLTVSRQGDLVDAQLRDEGKPVLEDKLETIGRLLGATRLMDMRLTDKRMVSNAVADFFSGKYRFPSISETGGGEGPQPSISPQTTPG